ncbi:MAG: hypothetical protein COW03_13330 [Cytophagales bacterium CG12_big_fil_rev_8_21_14_0_65_40_12]|nr:MAG: hypothetical protein COW03_13330 [Cytophagales bacterium CG12_big_fil_rev_8_21_14_0_65_40_12]PIW03118.1 MAG: hypothetical protein COW40_17405 [Cytophagales bacterium CG17_big_fil_post_rev_8_21_14_2_50_40_13]
MNSKSAIVVCLLWLFACTPKRSEIVQFEARKTDSVSTDNLVPESFIISSKVKGLNGGMVYWDSAVEKLIVLDGNDALKERLISKLGDGPEEIDFFAGFDITEDYIFVFGTQCLVYKKTTLDFLGKFKLPNADIHWVKEFDGDLLLGGLNYEANEYVVFSSKFNSKDGFTEIHEAFTVAFPEDLDELSKITEAEVMGENLFILKPHIGELIKVNKSYKQVFDKPLPYRFDQEENVIEYPDGEIDIERLESWSFSSYNNKLLVLRDLDMSEPDKASTKTHRNTIHVLDQDGLFLGRIRIDNKAVYISAIGKRLYAIDPVSEKYVVYEVLD